MADTSLVSVRDAREKTIAVLSDLFATDKLNLEDFERRVSLVHRASTLAEVEEAVSDLQKPDHSVKPVHASALVPMSSVPARQTRLAILGGVDRRGSWSAPKRMRIVAVMGGVQLDYREARVPAGVVEVSVFALMGGVHIIVPPELAVEISGSAILGGFEELNRTPAQPDPDRPTLRIHGFAMMGGVSIETRLVGESSGDARRRLRKERKEQRELRRLEDKR
jgi:hypothetical protein